MKWPYLDYEELARRYETGETYEELALDVDCSPSTLRKWMQGKGHTARRKGAQANKAHSNTANPVPAKTGPKIHKAPKKNQGRRRRSKW